LTYLSYTARLSSTGGGRQDAVFDGANLNVADLRGSDCTHA